MANKDYRALVSMLYGGSVGDDEMYQELMKKEGNVLDTVNRVANQMRTDATQADEFVNLPIVAVIHRVYTSVRAVMKDLPAARNAKQLRDVIMRDDRRIYIGVLLICVALFLLLLQGE